PKGSHKFQEGRYSGGAIVPQGRKKPGSRQSSPQPESGPRGRGAGPAAGGGGRETSPPPVLPGSDQRPPRRVYLRRIRMFPPPNTGGPVTSTNTSARLDWPSLSVTVSVARNEPSAEQAWLVTGPFVVWVAPS